MLVFQPSNKVYFDLINTHTTCPLAKLLHQHLRPYIVEK